AWVYNSSMEELATNANAMIEFYNSEVERWKVSGKPSPVGNFIDSDSRKISWADGLKQRLQRGKTAEFDVENIRPSMYRPFQAEHVYFSADLNERRYRLKEVFPNREYENFGFYNVGASSAVPFSVLMTDIVPNLHLTGAGSGGQFFARY